jgi:hypothetical protein
VSDPRAAVNELSVSNYDIVLALIPTVIAATTAVGVISTVPIWVLSGLGGVLTGSLVGYALFLNPPLSG